MTSDPAPVIELVETGTRRRLRVPVDAVDGQLLGSASSAGFRLRGSDVRDHHARLRWSADELRVEPVGSAPVSVNGQPVLGPSRLAEGDWLALGGAVFQVGTTPGASETPGGHDAVATTRAATAPPRPEATPSIRLESASRIAIGRLPENDVVVPSPLVSRHHALLESDGRAWQLRDLGSTNGSFVDGRRVEQPVALRGGERIQIGGWAFVFSGESLRPVAGEGLVRLEARQLQRSVPDAATGGERHLLAGIDLAIEPGEFVGIFGPSGSGKSTLLDALNGRRPASRGHVLYNGVELYAAFEQFRSLIGYVPQQDIVHRKIRVRRALEYTARLRLPEDTSGAEIDQVIGQVLDQLGLADKADQPIDTPMPLSGGQFKRVSLAVELVANPSILFLDEVTSGLDAGTDKRMMRLFAELAADRKTVVCVTHTLENIDACSLVVLLCEGRLVYLGPPEGVPDHFEIPRISDVYEALEKAPARDWEAHYRSSPLWGTYVGARQQTEPEAAVAAAATALSPAAPTSRFDLRQTWLLTRRYVDLMLADRRNLAILLLQAPLIAAVIGLVFDTGGSLVQRARAESQVSFMLVISGIWLGCLNAVREVVKELPVYLRERAVNLGIGPYAASKLLPLALLGGIQCALMLGMLTLLLPIPGNLAGRFAVLFASTLAASAMGLAVSAFVASSDKAVATVPVLLIPQVVLSGAIVPLAGVAEWVARLSMISYWGYDGLKATLSDEVRAAPDPLTGEALLPVVSSLGTDLGALLLLFSALLVVALVGLRLKNVRR